MDIGTVENVWLRKMWYLRIDKTPMKLGNVFKKRSINNKKNKLKLAVSTTNRNKFKKNKSTLLIISATFFNQYQFIATQIDLDHSNTSDENSIKIIKLLIESSDKYHKWYLNLYALTHFTNNKRYFKSYRQINNYIISTITNDLFLIKEIEII
jgi:hypothetical protein